MGDDIENAWTKLGDLSINEGFKKPLQEVQNFQSPSRVPGKESGQSESETDHNEDDQIRFNKLVTRSKKHAAEGDVAQALDLNKRALKIHYTDKLAKRIKKMEAYLAELGSEEDDDDSMEHVGDGFYLYRDLYCKLFAHQKEGVLWFWKLSRKKKGGILGDDMGLGKTIQVIAFLSGMFDMAKVNSVLIVMPVSLIGNWEKEFAKWAPGIRVKAYHGNSKKEKERALAKVQYRGGVLLTSYGLVVTSWQQLSQKDGSEFVWDYAILDEGHKIKNPTKTTKGVHAISAKNRIILTGTPIQNNLRELWALFDFVHQGQLLGTARTFKMEYDTPITRSRERDATAGERHLGQEMAESLKRIIEPYFLRRTKAEVTAKTKREESTESENTKNLAKMPSLGRKNDFVIWLFLTQTQLKIYEDFLALDSVKELLMTSRSPLVALTVLKKICDHPRLLSIKACTQLGLNGEEAVNDEDDESPSAHESAVTKIAEIEDSVLLQESGKLIVLTDLLDNLKAEGHRCLIFSQSRKMLDIIQKVINNRGHKVMRLDGTVTKIEERDRRIKIFQTDNSYSVFLLTTQVGGVGLTLTAADRVVIFDPSWNPATDAQAVDRVFRIGQNKNVVIYRLITCGSVEEKIYRRQIFKDSITRQTTGNSKNPYRYFTKGELRELFSLDDSRNSKTQRQLQEMHGVDRRSDPKLDAHIAFLHSLDMFGVSDHDLMFSQEHANDVDSDGEQEVRAASHTEDYIQHRVQKAQELLQMESSVSATLEERLGKYPRNCDVEPRQNRPPTNFNFFQPKINDQKQSRPKGSSDYESDVPLPSKVDVTVITDEEEEDQTKDELPSIKREYVQEIEDSPVKVKVKVEGNPLENFKAGSVIEILDTPVKVKKEEVEIYDGDVSMTESDDLPPGLDAKKDTSPQSETTEYNSCEEFPTKEMDSSLSGEPGNVQESNTDQTGVPDADIDDVIDRIDQSMNISKQLSDDEVMEKSLVNMSRMNATCERIEDYLAESDEEEVEAGLVEPETSTEQTVKGDQDLKRKLQTPERKKRLIVEQEILISPEPASPLMEMKAKRQRRLSKVASPAKFLCQTLMSCASDTPEVDSRSSTSSTSSDRLQATYVEESPKSRGSSSSSSRGSPRTSLKSFHVAESTENTPVFQNHKMDTSVSKDVVVGDSDEETPVKKNKKKRRSVCARNLVIASSDEESSESRSHSRGESEGPPLDESGSGSMPRSASAERSAEDRSGSLDESIEEGSIGDGSVSDEEGSEIEESVDESGVEEGEVDDPLVSEEEEEEAGPAEDCGDGNSGEEEEEGEEDSDDRDFIDDEESAEEEEEEESQEGSDEGSDYEDVESGINDLSPSLRAEFEKYVQKGRSLYLTGEFEEALANILQALEIYSDPQLQTLALTMHKEMES